MHKSMTITLFIVGSTAAFAPGPGFTNTRSISSLKGYLDDLTSDLYGEDPNPVPEEESRESTKMDKSKISNSGPGSFEDFVEFNEFDGGDGQMGVAGDGSGNALEKMDSAPVIMKSKQMSAKNAWGTTSTGYAEELMDGNANMDVARAQQLENWANQQEVRMKNQQVKAMSENFDQAQTSDEENWRQLAKFGVEKNTDVNLDEELGAVAAGDIEGVIELTSAMGRVATHELNLRNPFMGFADFRAAFTAGTPSDWIIEPAEGALKQREDTCFTVKFKPQGPGTVQGYLVIETEDFKKTWQVVGST